MASESDIFATLHHLVSRIDAESRVEEVVTKAQNLKREETQLLVDCLSLALDRNAAPLKFRTHIWRSLVRVAEAAQLFAQSHTLRSDAISSTSDSSYSIYSVSGEPSSKVKLVKQPKNDLYSEQLVSWSHISHPNIIPLYAIFLDGDDGPSLVCPCVTGGSICNYVRGHLGVPRMPLISDVVNGLSHIHQLDIVHGGLFPESVMISGSGRAYLTNIDVSLNSEEFDSLPARYSAPELLGEDDNIKPTKATDMWSLACLCYEVLSGKTPFFHIAKEFRVVGAVSQGGKPVRTGQGDVGGNEIDDAIWQLLLMCWKFEPGERPLCLKIHQIFMGMGIQDTRLEAKPMVLPQALKGLSVDLKLARARLMGVLGSEDASSLRVPEHLRNLLLRLIPDTAKFDATATAAKKLNPNDTQCLVDFLDLALEDFPEWKTPKRLATQALLSTVILSTRIIPQRYMVNGVQYDSQALIAEGSFGKAYEGRGLKIRVNVMETSGIAARTLLMHMPNWFHSSHPNLFPFYGVFHEGANESPRLFVVTPLWKNGNLHDYASTLPQKARMPLISDVSSVLVYLHATLKLVSGTKPITPYDFLVSDQGHAVLLFFGTYRFSEATTSTYELRFTAPNSGFVFSSDIWSFGCLCYEVLSKKPPYYQYAEASQIQTAVSQGETPRRPDPADDIDEIDDRTWDMIMACFADRWQDRPSALAIQELITSWGIEDDRPEAESLPGVDMLALRSRPSIDFPYMETLLSRIQVELLREPLSKLVQNRINDVAAAAAKLQSDDTRTLVDFLDRTLKDHLSISEERNRVLALLSKITSSTHIFPQRYELKGIRYGPRPIAEGGFGKVYQASDYNMCVKVMAQVDPKTLTEWIKELIIWAHSSHPNVLSFYGVFLEDARGAPDRRICLVSPYMINKNVHEYAPRLSQQARLPLILDVIKGLQYLHGLGIVHSDLKGQNVLISDEGRCLITDFGASHIVTATAAATGSSLYTTLRFSAPEVVLGGPRWQPTKECDIWSFGCLCLEVLSRRVPYYEYKLDVQVTAALSRKELPRRPGSTTHNDADEADGNDWDDDEEDDWDAIDDPAWSLITKCCAPEPENRLEISIIQELIADMKVWDDRPAMKAIPGAEIFKLRLNPDIDLNRVGELLDSLQRVVAPSEPGHETTFVDLWNTGL